MKKRTLVILLLFAYAAIKAQDYKVSFAGTGASTTVGTVTVENLTQGTKLNLNGSDVLHLVKFITGIEPTVDNVDNFLRIYPNPSSDITTIDFVATASGIAIVELFDIAGKKVGSAQNTLTIGTHSYEVNGILSGIYTVRISSKAYNYTGKLVSNGAPGSDAKISYRGNSVMQVAKEKLKSANAEKTMQYNTGDRLKIIGTSGNYSTIVADVLTKSKTITFNFTACTDANGYNYTVVQIGTQIWMGENLKTTKYRNGEIIPNTEDNNVWAKLTTGAECSYNNDASNLSTYGKLYNWYALNDLKNISPIGWHVPSDAEWIKLTSYLGGDASIKLKKFSTLWYNPIFSIIYGTNESYFSAIPGGYRNDIGSYSEIRNKGYWWTSTEIDTSTAFGRNLYSFDNNVHRIGYNKTSGFSVRCIKD